MKKYYTNSDIFNSYVEIAERQGLVKVAEDSDASKKALENSPRADSLSKERISKLYGVEIDTPKEMEYSRNIVEVAHPKSKYIHNAYDKLNGLVENVNERQDIMLRIVNKRTNGTLAQHKYAQDEMIRTLVRIANDMDNRNEEDLRSLADECLQGLKKNSGWLDDFTGIFTGKGKTPEWARPIISTFRADAPVAAVAGLTAAILGAPVWGTVGAFTAAGALVAPVISWMFAMAPPVQRIHENCAYVLDELDDFQEKISTNTPEGTYLQSLNKSVADLQDASEAYYKNFTDLQSADQEDAAESHLEENPQIAQVVQNLKKQIEACKKILAVFDSRYETIVSEYRKKMEFSVIRSKIIDWLSPSVSGLNPILQLSDAVNSLKKSIKNYEDDGKKATEKLKEGAQEIIQATENAAKDRVEKTKRDADKAAKEKMGITDSEEDQELWERIKGDNLEELQSEARKKIINLIKNS